MAWVYRPEKETDFASFPHTTPPSSSTTAPPPSASDGPARRSRASRSATSGRGRATAARVKLLQLLGTLIQL